MIGKHFWMHFCQILGSQSTVQYHIYNIYYTQMAKYFVFLESWTFCCPILGSGHCTRAHTETVDSARWPIAYLNSGTGPVLYGSGKWGLIWEKTLRPSPFTHLAVLSTYAEYCSVMSRIAYCLLIHWLISVHDWRAADGFLPSDWLNGLTVMIGKIISVLWLAYCNSFLCLPNWFFLVIGWQFSVVWQANGHVLCNGSNC